MSISNKIESSVKAMLVEHNVTSVVVGLSGGIDSVVLTHALSMVCVSDVLCLHVNHGISDSADDWEEHCRAITGKYGFNFNTLNLSLKGVPNLESVAREFRYKFFEDHISSGAALMTAHHLDDQAETFMLRLMRGSGVDGLASMRPSRPIGDGVLLRPLLDFTKVELIEYAKENGLSWVEDESNLDSDYDRNFLRNEVLPLLQTRWAHAPKAIAKAAKHMQSAQGHLDEVAKKLVAKHVYLNRVRLTAEYKAIDAESKALLIREWMSQNELPAINASRLCHFINRVDEIDRVDNLLCVDVTRGVQVKHYGGYLHIVYEDEYLEVEFEKQSNDDYCSFGISVPSSELERIPYNGKAKVKIDNRTFTVKSFLKERKVPLWERDAYPILAYKGDIVLVGSWICLDYMSISGEIPKLVRKRP